MENAALFSILAGGAISVLTQMLKRLFPEVTPLIIAAYLSVIGGIGFTALTHFGVWEVFKENVTVAFAASVAIYEVLKALDIMRPNT